MNATAIIERFELQVDDLTELSTTEELALLNEKYQDALAERPWNFLKVSAADTLDISDPSIFLPDDFAFLSPNYLSTDNNVSEDLTSAPYVVFVGTNYRPYKIINYSDRRQYRDQDGYAYVDLANGRIVFTKQPTTAETYEYDYIKLAPELAATDTPLIPTRFLSILWLDMAIDDDIIQKSEKARSYASENKAKRDAKMMDMKFWDSQFQMN